MRSFIEITAMGCPVLVAVSAITDVWQRDGDGADIYTRSSGEAYIHASESYDDIKRMIRVALGEDEEPRPIYRTMTAKEFWKLKAMAKEITADDR